MTCNFPFPHLHQSLAVLWNQFVNDWDLHISFHSFRSLRRTTRGNQEIKYLPVDIEDRIGIGILAVVCWIGFLSFRLKRMGNNGTNIHTHTDIRLNTFGFSIFWANTIIPKGYTTTFMGLLWNVYSIVAHSPTRHRVIHSQPHTVSHRISCK